MGNPIKFLIDRFTNFINFKDIENLRGKVRRVKGCLAMSISYDKKAGAEDIRVTSLPLDDSAFIDTFDMNAVNGVPIEVTINNRAFDDEEFKEIVKMMLSSKKNRINVVRKEHVEKWVKDEAAMLRVGLDTKEIMKLEGKPIVPIFSTASGSRTTKWIMMIPFEDIKDIREYGDKVRDIIFGKELIAKAKANAKNEAEFMSRIGLIMSTTTYLGKVKAVLVTDEMIKQRYREVYGKAITNDDLEEVLGDIDGHSWYIKTERFMNLWKKTEMKTPPNAFIFRSQGDTLCIKGCMSNMPEQFIPEFISDLDVDVIITESCTKVPVETDENGCFEMDLRYGIRDKVIKGSTNFEFLLAVDQKKAIDELKKMWKKEVFKIMYAMSNVTQAQKMLSEINDSIDYDDDDDDDEIERIKGYLEESMTISEADRDKFYKRALVDILRKKLDKVYRGKFPLDGSRFCIAAPDPRKLWYPKLVPVGCFHNNKKGVKMIFRCPLYLPSDISRVNLYKNEILKKTHRNILVFGWSGMKKNGVPVIGVERRHGQGADFDGDGWTVCNQHHWMMDVKQEDRYAYVELEKTPGKNKTHDDLCESMYNAITSATLMGIVVTVATTYLDAYYEAGKNWNCKELHQAGDSIMISADSAKRGSDIHIEKINDEESEFDLIIKSDMFGINLPFAWNWARNYQRPVVLFEKKSKLPNGKTFVESRKYIFQGKKTSTIPSTFAQDLEEHYIETLGEDAFDNNMLFFYAEVGASNLVDAFSSTVCDKYLASLDREYSNEVSKAMNIIGKMKKLRHSEIYTKQETSDVLDAIYDKYRTLLFQHIAKLAYTRYAKFLNMKLKQRKTAKSKDEIAKIDNTIAKVRKIIDVFQRPVEIEILNIDGTKTIKKYNRAIDVLYDKELSYKERSSIIRDEKFGIQDVPLVRTYAISLAVLKARANRKGNCRVPTGLAIMLQKQFLEAKRVTFGNLSRINVKLIDEVADKYKKIMNDRIEKMDYKIREDRIVYINYDVVHEITLKIGNKIVNPSEKTRTGKIASVYAKLANKGKDAKICVVDKFVFIAENGKDVEYYRKQLNSFVYFTTNGHENMKQASIHYQEINNNLLGMVYDVENGIYSIADNTEVEGNKFELVAECIGMINDKVQSGLYRASITSDGSLVVDIPHTMLLRKIPGQGS